MKTGITLAAATLFIAGANAFGSEPSQSAILDKVVATYQSMQTYKADGAVTTTMEGAGRNATMEISFSILLAKPNLYLISWQQNMSKEEIGQVLLSTIGPSAPPRSAKNSGAVWSDGTQPYLYMGVLNAYAKMSSDTIALSSATGISGGAAFTIPSLFLPAFKATHASPFSRLTDLKIEKSEKVDDDDCYVVSGASAVSKKESYWISKKTYWIRKYERSLDAPAGGRQMPEPTAEQLDQAIRNMGQPVTDETRKKMKEMVDRSREMMKTMNLKGSSTEVHTQIASPDVTTISFRYSPPEGAVLKESLFGGILQGIPKTGTSDGPETIVVTRARPSEESSPVASPNQAVSSGVEMRVIELRDHPDPNTGTNRVIENEEGWPLDVDALLSAISRKWSGAAIDDMRRGPLLVGAEQEFGETNVRVLDLNPKTNMARLSVRMYAAAEPLDLTVPVNSTVVIGSEANGQRHAFEAVSVFDRKVGEGIPQIFTTLEPGITAPVKVSGAQLQAPADIRARGQRFVLAEVEIDERGNVVNVHAIAPPADRAPIEKEILSWTFTPATRDGKPVRVFATLQSRFCGVVGPVIPRSPRRTKARSVECAVLSSARNLHLRGP